MTGLPSAASVRRHIAYLYARGEAPAEYGEPVQLEPTAVPADAAAALDALAAAERATRTLEVGLGVGLASLALCAALLEVGGSEPRHLTLDPLQGELFRGAGRRALHDAGVAPICEVLERESQLVLPRLVAEGRSFDLALIDGDHRFEAAFVDMAFADRLLRPGGVLVADDVWMPPVRAAVFYLETNLGYRPVAPVAAALRSRRSRHPLRRRARVGRAAVLRKPAAPRERDWGAFERFVAR